MRGEKPTKPQPATQTAPAIATARADAEPIRRALQERGLLQAGLVPAREDDQVLFPLTPQAETASRSLLDEFPGATLTTHRFETRDAQPADYRDRLKALPEDLRAQLPRAHDVVGDIAIVKLPEALLPHKTAIAQAMMDAQARVRTVALDQGVTGDQRVRKLEVLAGEPGLTTIHREHGLELEVALDKVYFSPRLATERKRLLERIQNGQRVLDLFAGVGAFVCLVAKNRTPETITAVDINPNATELLAKNLTRNKIDPTGIQVVEGDARQVAPTTADWDHVVLNLPHDAHRFLDVAAACVSPDGEIHLYAILERDDEATYVEATLTQLHQHTGRPWQVAQRRHVRQYAPTMDGLAFTLKATGRPGHDTK